MKAITVHNPFATLIARGEKTLEIRSWKTPYRGDILIVCSRREYADCPRGVALCIVRLADVRPFTPADAPAACIAYQLGLWAWVLADVRLVTPFPVRGKQGFYDVAYPAQNSQIQPVESAPGIESLPLFALRPNHVYR